MAAEGQMRLSTKLISAADARKGGEVLTSLSDGSSFTVGMVGRDSAGGIVLFDEQGIRHVFARDRLLVLLNPRSGRARRPAGPKTGKSVIHYTECPADTDRSAQCICTRLARQ